MVDGWTEWTVSIWGSSLCSYLQIPHKENPFFSVGTSGFTPAFEFGSVSDFPPHAGNSMTTRLEGIRFKRVSFICLLKLAAQQKYANPSPISQRVCKVQDKRRGICIIIYIFLYCISPVFVLCVTRINHTADRHWYKNQGGCISYPLDSTQSNDAIMWEA